MHFLPLRSVGLVSVTTTIVLLLSAAECRSGPVPSVNFIFETFSPYGMIKFFEFSDKGWNITEDCLKNMYSFLEGLQRGSIWAVKLYDSIHYYSGSAFSGNRYRIESSAQCRQLQAEYHNILKMHWSLKTNTSAIPFPLQLLNAKYEIEMNYNVYEVFTVQQSICFPQLCNSNDLKQILATTGKADDRIVKNMTLISFRPVDRSYDVFEDGSFYTLNCLFAMVLIATSCSYVYERISDNDHDLTPDKKISEVDSSSLPSDITIDDLECAIEQLSKLSSCDKNSLTKVNMHHSAECMTINNMNNNNHVNLVKVKKVKTRNSATISLDIIAGNCEFAKATRRLQMMSSRGPFWKILISFSWRLNFENLTKRTSSELDISAMRGLQVVCTVLIILGHTCAVMEHLTNNRYTLSTATFEFLKFVKGHSTYLIDMFFFLSGAHLTYFYFKTSCQGKWNVLEQIIHFLAMITYKICSIILPYIVILTILELTAKYFYSNSALDIPSVDHITCENDKWLNVLYIDKFVPLVERCMLWSWFISLEVHFFIAASLVLLLAQIHPKSAGAICTGIFVSSIMAAAVVEIDSPHFVSAVKQSIDDELMSFNLIFDKIWVRIPPYLLGMCLGYTLYKTQGKFDINIFVVIFGWIACIFIVIGFGYGFQTVAFRINPWVRAIVSILGHTVWSMVLFWIILASISQYGGLISEILASKLCSSLGKLTNCCLLIGPLIIRVMLQSNESGVHLSIAQLFIAFLGFTVSSFFAAFLLHMLFEAPLLVLLKMIYKMYRKNDF